MDGTTRRGVGADRASATDVEGARDIGTGRSAAAISGVESN